MTTSAAPKNKTKTTSHASASIAEYTRAMFSPEYTVLVILVLACALVAGAYWLGLRQCAPDVRVTDVLRELWRPPPRQKPDRRFTRESRRSSRS